METGRSGSLTQREKEILTLVAQGVTTPEIASRLYLSTYTVDNHVRNVREKLRAHNRVEAVARAYEEGWLTDA